MIIVKSPRLPRHLLVAGSAWASRIVAALLQLASVRILMDNLGMENYAVFVLLTGLLGWFMLADLGLGVCVQNYISESRAKNHPYDDLIVTSGILAVLLLFVTIIGLYFVSPYVAPLLLKKFSFLDEAEKTKLFFLTGVISIGLSVGGIIYKVWYAEQRGYLSNIFPAAAALVGFGGVLLLKQISVEDKLFLNLAVFTAPTAIFPLLALLLQQLKIRRRSPEHLSMKLPGTILHITKRGLHFWFFAIMSAGVLQIDYIVMSQFLNYHDIAVYNLSTKVFGLVFFIYSAVLMALWPIFSESIAKRDWDLVQRYLKKYLALGLIFMLACTVLFIWLMPVAVGMLAPKEKILVPLGLILLLGVYQMIRIWTDTFAVLLQSISVLTPFWIYVPIQAMLSVVLQWLLAPIYGLYGIVLGLITSFVFTVMWALPLAVRKKYQLHQQEQS